MDAEGEPCKEWGCTLFLHPAPTLNTHPDSHAVHHTLPMGLAFSPMVHHQAQYPLQPQTNELSFSFAPQEAEDFLIL